MTRQFYFTKVLALPGGEALLTGHLISERDEPTFTRLFVVSEHGWKLLGDMQDIVYALARGPLIEGIRPDVFVLGRDGTYRMYSSGVAPVQGSVPKRDVTYLEGACFFGESVYVCGGQNQAFRLRNNRWEDLSAGVYETFTGRLTSSLEAVAACSASEVLFVGDSGSMYFYKQTEWEKLESPTNVNLLAVHSVGSVFLVGGTNGVFLSVDGSGSVRDLSCPTIDACRIAAFAEFNGEVYLAATKKLCVWRNYEVVEIPTPNDLDINSIASISGCQDHLWITGGEQVLRHRRAAWDVFVCPDSV